MDVSDFRIERYYDRWEFTVPHHLSPSDCETLTVGELLELAGEPVSVLTDEPLGYTECRGDPRLRAAVAGLYERIGPDEVLVTNAPEEAIFVGLSALLERGERVVVQTPCYQSLLEIARRQGCEVVPWPLLETDESWRLDLDALESLLAIDTKLLVVNAPHNPTGHHATAAEMDRIVELARRRGTWLFFDEMYRGLERDPARRLPSAVDRYERAIALWGMSKTFGLPGLRIGWLALRDRALLGEMVRHKDWTTICSSGPGQVLARVALEHAETIIARNVGIVAANLAHLDRFRARHPDLLDWRAPAAGSVSFPRLRRGSATAFCDRARETGGVLLVPSPLFEFGDRHVRIGLGRRSFPADLEALERVLATGETPV